MTNKIIDEDIAEIALELDLDSLRGKKVLIAGAGGFLPAYMAETFLYLNESQNINCKIFALVRNLAKAAERFAHYANRSDLTLIQSDVSAPLINLPRADIIIHAASPASPKYYGHDPVGVMHANLLGMNNLLDMARLWKTENFLFFSSGEVYGQVPSSAPPIKEKDYGYIDILNVRSCYAESKRAAETLGVSYWKQHGVPCKIVRPFHTYGPGMALDDGRVFADFVADVVHHRDITLKSDGSAIRAFCYLSDAVRGFFKVLLSGQSGIAYNVANPEGVLSILELAQLLVGMRPGLRVEHIGSHADSNYLQSPIARNIPDIELISSLGWIPRYLPQEGFSRTLRSFMEV
jgi:nucleoside-diphosphate-sugar epimerase